VKFWLKSNIYLFVFACLNTFLNAQNAELYRLNIEPLNKANMYFNQSVEFKTRLSADKTKITVEIENCKVSENAANSSSTGIISDVVSIINSKGNLEVDVITRDKRGYTALYLPYSRQISIEVFRWDALSTEEDLYRSGLLALEDDIFAEAESSMDKASEMGHPNSPAIIGIAQLINGDIETAYKNLILAAKRETIIPDAYAALAQIYRARGEDALAAKFEEKFLQKANLEIFAELPIYIPDNIELNEEVDSFFENKTETDSNLVKVEAKPDSSAIAKNNITKSKEGDAEDILPTEILTYILYALAIFAIAFLAYYLSIRVKNLAENKRNVKDEFENALKAARINRQKREIEEEKYINNKKPAQAPEEELKFKVSKQKPTANTPSVSGKFFDKKSKEKKNTIQPEYTEKVDDLMLHLTQTYKLDPETMRAPEIADIDNVKEIDNHKQVEDFLNKFIERSKGEEQVKEMIKEKTNPNKVKLVPENSIEAIEQKADAKVDLALHLAKKHQDLKQANLKNLKPTDIPDDQELLLAMAQKMGVDPGSLEIIKNLDRLENNNQDKSKLSEKFNVRKKNSSR